MNLDAKDIFPETSALLEKYEAAMLLKKNGNFLAAERILVELTSKPSIYHGHYRELFILQRKRIKQLVASEEYAEALSLLEGMVEKNESMINAMCDYWSPIHGVKREKAYFSSYGKINKTDTKLIEQLKSKIRDPLKK